TWAMRLKAPKVPRAAAAAFGAAFGPRVLPGTYTVKMTKDKQVYTTKLSVTADPRAKHTAADRKMQFDLSMKLYNLFGDMTFAVDRINGVRLALDERAGKLPAGDPLAKRLQAASIAVDELRQKIVATKEGGMITGEERLREFLSDLYGSVVFYEGRPSQAQVEVPKSWPPESVRLLQAILETAVRCALPAHAAFRRSVQSPCLQAPALRAHPCFGTLDKSSARRSFLRRRKAH
ncbi:MAG: hypothetical protein ACREBC_13920, partial [Pyrinomonadaceae bacterium]